MEDKSPETKPTHPCWECRKRRLVCDNSQPTCKKCEKSGKACPGYGDQKPLQWLEPGLIQKTQYRSSTRKDRRAHARKSSKADDSSSQKLSTSSDANTTRSSSRPNPAYFNTFTICEVEDASNQETLATLEQNNLIQTLSFRNAELKHGSPESSTTCAKESERDVRPPLLERQPRRISSGKDVLRLNPSQLQIQQQGRPLRIREHFARNLMNPGPLPGLNEHDTPLFHFYASRTFLTLAGPRTQDIWQSHAVRDGHSYPFLMHGLLALAALQQSCQQPEKNSYYVTMAIKHHESALNTFRTGILDVNHANSFPLVMFSLATAVFSLGVANIHGFAIGASPTSMFLNVLGSLRTAWASLGSERQKLERGPLRFMMNITLTSHRQPLGKESKELLDGLVTYIETCGEGPEIQAEYLKTMRSLEDYFWHLPELSPFSELVGWPLDLSDTFFALMCEKKPFPLLCLTYFMITFCHTQNVWLTPWVKPVLNEIWWLLDDSLRRFMYWPALYIGKHPAHVHSDRCRCFDCYMNEKISGFRWRATAAPLAGSGFTP